MSEPTSKPAPRLLPNLGPAPPEANYPYPKREPPPPSRPPSCELHPGAPLACRACSEILVVQAHQAGAASMQGEVDLARAQLAACETELALKDERALALERALADKGRLALPPGCTCRDAAPGPCPAALAEAAALAEREP